MSETEMEDVINSVADISTESDKKNLKRQYRNRLIFC